MSKQMVLDMIARSAGTYSLQPGRAWRSVEDTTHDPIMSARKPKASASLNRGEDYYSEGALIWLEADQIIRAGTGGKRGLDDFASRFFGIRDGDWGQVTYTFEDVVGDLNAIHPYDWTGFLTTRMRETNQPAPLAGIEKAGYRLVWKEEPNSYDKSRLASSKTLELVDSLGINIDKDAKITSVRWDSPGFAAGLVTGGKILAVNGRTYDADRIKAAITEAKTSGKPIELLVQRGETIATVPVNYSGGLRWPWLEPVGKGTQALDRLLAPRTR